MKMSGMSDKNGMAVMSPEQERLYQIKLLNQRRGCRIHDSVVLHDHWLSNLYGCEIGEQTRVGPFVEIQRGVRIGQRCKISSHSFICEGVEIEDEVFIGHHVCFTNDRFPRATNEDGTLKGAHDYRQEPTIVRRGASIGSGAVILPGIIIGEKSIIGAGSVVTKSVPSNTVVCGIPARQHLAFGEQRLEVYIPDSKGDLEPTAAELIPEEETA